MTNGTPKPIGLMAAQTLAKQEVAANVPSRTSLQTAVSTSWPAWAEAAVDGGQPSAWFNAADKVATMTAEQRASLPALANLAETRLQPPSTDECKFLANRLITIAVRVQPGMSETAGQAWGAALAASLARNPADLLARAISEAEVTQFQYLNEVGPFIAEQIREPRRLRIAKASRLQQMQRAAQGLPSVAGQYCTPEEAAAILKESGL